MDAETKNLFSNVRYYLIDTDPNIEALLNTNGAKSDKYLSSFITHVICDNTDHSDYSEAKEVFDLVIVKVWYFLFNQTLS